MVEGYWRCRHCGYVSTIRPSHCPRCDAPGYYFEFVTTKSRRID